MKNLSKYIVLATLMVVPVLVGGGVSAHEHERDVTPTLRADREAIQAEKQERRAEAQAQREENKTERQSERCFQFQARIADRVEKYQLRLRKHGERYEHVSDVLQTVVDRLQAANIDTSSLESVIANMQADSMAFQASVSEVISDLQALQEMDCDATDPEILKAEVQSIREMFVELKSKAEDLHDYKDEIKDEIETLKEEVEEQE